MTVPEPQGLKRKHHKLKHQLTGEERDRALAFLGTQDAVAAGVGVLALRQRELQAAFERIYGTPTASCNNEWLRGKLLQALGLGSRWRPPPPEPVESPTTSGSFSRYGRRRRTVVHIDMSSGSSDGEEEEEEEEEEAVSPAFGASHHAAPRWAPRPRTASPPAALGSAAASGALSPLPAARKTGQPAVPAVSNQSSSGMSGMSGVSDLSPQPATLAPLSRLAPLAPLILPPSQLSSGIWATAPPSAPSPPPLLGPAAATPPAAAAAAAAAAVMQPSSSNGSDGSSSGHHGLAAIMALQAKAAVSSQPAAAPQPVRTVTLQPAVPQPAQAPPAAFQSVRLQPAASKAPAGASLAAFLSDYAEPPLPSFASIGDLAASLAPEVLPLFADAMPPTLSTELFGLFNSWEAGNVSLSLASL